MRIVVTGGAGFMGSHFIRHVLNRYPAAQVLNYDKLTYAGNLGNLKDVANDKRYNFVKGDIADIELFTQLFQEFKPDYVINFAAETHVDRAINLAAEEFLSSFIHSNIIGTHGLLEVIKRYKNLKNFVQVSTDEVYGSLELDSGEKFTENTSLNPKNLYAVTKASADLMCQSYHNHFGVPVVIVRPTNLFGSHQYPEKLIPYSVARMLQGKKILLHGDGKHVRDWLYVIDCASALELCLFKGRSGQVYNVGSNNERSNLEIVRLILNYFNRDDSWIDFVEDRPGNDRRYSTDSTKIQKELGRKSNFQFEDAFRKTIDWYVNNPEWLEQLFKKNKNFDIHNYHDPF